MGVSPERLSILIVKREVVGTSLVWGFAGVCCAYEYLHFQVNKTRDHPRVTSGPNFSPTIINNQSRSIGRLNAQKTT